MIIIRNSKSTCLVLAMIISFLFTESALAQSDAAKDTEAELAKKLQNPIAALISMPIQSNWDLGAGPENDGYQYKANIQPVIPFSLNDEWNVISRTILPVISQHDIIGETNQDGISDIVQSFFFSPQQPTSNGWIWGAGPVMLLPTASDDLLGTEKWGLGPTVVALKQENGWTYGALTNHIWSVAGDSDRQDVNATFLQPFLGYTTSTYTTFTLNTESTYDWANSQLSAPVNLLVAQLVKIGGLPIQFQVGPRYYVEGPSNGPDWGLRFNVTLLLPAS